LGTARLARQTKDDRAVIHRILVAPQFKNDTLTVSRIILFYLLALFATTAHAHDPYEITSVVYVRSNVIELFVEMEFPTGMKLAGVEPVRGVAALTQFEQAQRQLATLAGGFFDFTAGNNRVAALTTNVSLGVEDHIQFKLEYAATALRPLQFIARGLRGVSDSPYGTSLTVLDMVNQKVLGQTTLFADSPRVDFPPAITPEPSELTNSAAPTNMASLPAPTNSASAEPPVSVRDATPAPVPTRQPSWLLILLLLGAALLIAFAFFRRRE
jgi:hypothetical protein